MLQLFVLGPAFGLPSIDAECIATVALLKSLLGNDPERWSLSARHTTTDRLPELIDNGHIVNGFENIKHHLHKAHGLSLTQNSHSSRADSIAMSSFLTTYAPVLISAHLYVSYENYASTTRPAYTKILPLYARFAAPPTIRVRAIETTKHLGIASMDVDAASDQSAANSQKLNSSDPEFELSSQNKASLLLPRKDTVSSLLARKTEGVAVFRLRALSDSFFEPLQALLGDKKWLLDGDQPSELDCLAYGYLSLMLFPPVPRKWLPNIIEDSYPSVARYVKRLTKHLHVRTEADVRYGVQFVSDKAKTLPWTAEATTSATEVFHNIGRAIQENTALRSPVLATRDEHAAAFWTTYAPQILLTLSAAVLGGAYWLVKSSISTHRGQQEQIFGRSRMADFAHLNDALSGLSFMQIEAESDYRSAASGNAVPTEIDVEIET